MRSWRYTFAKDRFGKRIYWGAAYYIWTDTATGPSRLGNTWYHTPEKTFVPTRFILKGYFKHEPTIMEVTE